MFVENLLVFIVPNIGGEALLLIKRVYLLAAFATWLGECGSKRGYGCFELGAD